MKVSAGRSPGWRCRGWGAAEYVLLMFFATIAFLRGLQFALQMIREHHQEFSWALLLPF